MQHWILRQCWRHSRTSSALQHAHAPVHHRLGHLYERLSVASWEAASLAVNEQSVALRRLGALRGKHTTSVPDRRKRNHFPHDRKTGKGKAGRPARPEAENQAKAHGAGEGKPQDHQPGAGAGAKRSKGPKKKPQNKKNRQEQKQQPVFTNKFQNLLSFSLDDEVEAPGQSAERRQRDKHQASSTGRQSTSESVDRLLDLATLDVSVGEDDAMMDEHADHSKKYHHMSHKDRLRREQLLASTMEDERSGSSASSSEGSRKVKQPKQKKKKDGRSLLKNFKFENSIFNDDDELFDHVEWDDGNKQERRQQRRKEREQRMAAKKKVIVQATPQEVEIPTRTTVRDLAERMAVKSKVLLMTLKDLGERGLSEESVVTNDIAEVAVEAMNMIPVLLPPEFVDVELTVPPADCSMFPPRPPILSVMGHVDHGKTTLLDALRKSKVAASEHGGITQSIGAFTVDLGKKFGKLGTMTFIDTPGHAAFSSMRSRGSEVTDMIVLVVAADDGVRPQTVEVVNLALKHNAPVVVAITKCDMHGLEESEVVQRISTELLSHGLVTEAMGGEVPVVCVSGKTGEGLDSLKETIALHAEILDLRADTKAQGEAVVLEATVARGVGVQVDAIVKWGTLKNGDIVVCGLEYGKVRALVDQAGKRAKTMAPGNPVRIIGLKGLVNAGDALIKVESEERAKEVIEQRRELLEWDLMAAAAEEEDNDGDSDAPKRRRKFRGAKKKWEEIELRRHEAAEEAKRIASLRAGDEGYVASVVPIIVKTDTVGVIAAIDDLIASLPSDEAVIKRILAAVGPVSSSDLEMAAATGATVYCFNVKHPSSIDREALEKNVNIRQHRVIYSMLDDITELLRENLAGVDEEHVVGSAEVIKAIPISTSGRRTTNIAGCRVTSGSLTAQARYRLVRDGETIMDNINIHSMRHFQERVSEVTKGQECGLQFNELDQFEPGDILQAYVIKTVKNLL